MVFRFCRRVLSEKVSIVTTPGFVLECFESAHSLVGKDLPPGPWHCLSFDEITRFADLTGDRQWIHVDRERIARESPFGTPIAHGYFVVAKIAPMFLEITGLDRTWLVINYGMNRVRFPAPLRVGSEYRMRVHVDAARELPGGIELTFSAAIEVKNQEKPCLVAQVVFWVVEPADRVK